MYRLGQQYLRKVPEITAIFWITKILTTAMGESTSDFFVFKINPYLAVILGGIGLVIALILQFSVSKYVAWIYWFTVAMVAVFGTMVADVLHIQFGIPYLVSTIFFAVVLTLVFIVWYKSEKTLSIHTIYNSRRELFYWATVLATFALGTAAGDLTARTIGLGYFASGLLFAGIFAVPVIDYWLGLNKIFTFWFAYVLTRPFGASFADWFGKSTHLTGLGYGDGLVVIVLSVLIILCVAYMTFNPSEVRHEHISHVSKS